MKELVIETYKIAAFHGIHYNDFLRYTPAIFFIMVTELNKRNLEEIEMENMRCGQICASIYNTMSGKRKRYKWTDFFKQNKKQMRKEKQSVKEMEMNLIKFTKALGGEING